MLGAIITFLVGILILLLVLWVARLVIAQLGLPAPMQQIALAIVGVIGLVILLYLLLGVFNGTGPVYVGRPL
jgi:hypothetical protein